MTAPQPQAANGHRTTNPNPAADQAAAAYAFMGMQFGHNAQVLGDDYPLLQWMNGKPELRQLGGSAAFGGFVFKFDQDAEFPVGDLKEHTYSDGSTDQIFDIGAAHLCILASRVDWYHGTREDKVWLPKYEKGAKGRNRWLVLIKGAEEWHQANGPLLLSMYGVNGVLMDREVVKAFGRIRSKAGAILKRKLDDYTFWLPIVPGPAQKASDQYTTKITPPTLNFATSNQTVLRDLSELYIGDEMMALCASLWEEALAWAKKPLDIGGNGAGSGDNGAETARQDLGGVSTTDSSSYQEGPRPNHWTDASPPGWEDEQLTDVPF